MGRVTRILGFLVAPVVMASGLALAGWALRATDMMHTRLTYDSFGGPAAWVLFGVVVGYGLLGLLVDAVVRGVRRAVRPAAPACRPSVRRAAEHRPATPVRAPVRAPYARPATVPPTWR